MSEHSYDDIDEVLPEQPNGELVHWMEPRALSFGPAGLSLAVAGAFALGLATALIAIGVSRLAGPERRMSLPLARKLRGLN
ncbi:MAG: hypothetical protein JWQ97_1049 [Phenylobacterium sp.]|nr:hypothetical protein [Phenylobacterium sp.]